MKILASFWMHLVKAHVCLSILPPAPENTGQRWLHVLYSGPAESPLPSQQNQGAGARESAPAPRVFLAGGGGKASLMARHEQQNTLAALCFAGQRSLLPASQDTSPVARALLWLVEPQMLEKHRKRPQPWLTLTLPQEPPAQPNLSLSSQDPISVRPGSACRRAAPEVFWLELDGDAPQLHPVTTPFPAHRSSLPAPLPCPPEEQVPLHPKIIRLPHRTSCQESFPT